ncbi:hypothetical protein C8R43DRAFT_959426 [Mycena crocata]|nr:hypothetical protein C8R43DRAFT_959426 [Mycena crocata]
MQLPFGVAFAILFSIPTLAVPVLNAPNALEARVVKTPSAKTKVAAGPAVGRILLRLKTIDDIATEVKIPAGKPKPTPGKIPITKTTTKTLPSAKFHKSVQVCGYPIDIDIRIGSGIPFGSSIGIDGIPLVSGISVGISVIVIVIGIGITSIHLYPSALCIVWNLRKAMEAE